MVISIVAVMGVRVVAGIYKGRTLHSLGGQQTRPTSGRVREAVFSMLLGRVQGTKWLDLFAGSGAMGIEALSRGARFCFFVDNNRRACAIIRKNLTNLGLGPDVAALYCSGAEAACAAIADQGQAIDVCYLDPPYADGRLYERAIAQTLPLLAPTGLLIVEHPKGWQPGVYPGEHIKTRSYGLAAISVFQKGGASSG